jgi:hypothetical protein
MGVLDRPGHLANDSGGARRRGPAVIADELGEVAAGLQRHGEERLAVHGTGGKHLDDVRMAERGDGLHLLLEAASRLDAGEPAGGDDLECFLAVEPGVERSIHGSHAAAAEPLEDLVVAKAVGLEQGGRRAM